MAKKKNDGTEEVLVEDTVEIGSVVSASESDNAEVVESVSEEALEIPAKRRPRTPRNQHTQQAAQTSESHFIASGVEREALEAERSELWDIEQEDKTTVSIFLTAYKEKRILEGTIAGVETNNSGAYWVLYEGPVTIRIPFTSSFMTIPSDLAVARPSEDVIRRQRQMLDRAKGAKISFTISRFIPEGDGFYIAIASRTDALSKIRKSYFGNRATMPLEVGKDVMAQILTNGEHAAYLNFCGIDVKVKKSDLSHKFIQDITSTFHVGEKIRVRIMSIVPAKEAHGIPTVTVSGKPVEKEKFNRNLKRVKAKCTYVGTVISNTKKANADGSISVTVSLFLDHVGVPAFSRTTVLDLGDSLKQGDKVSFQASGVTEDGYAHGKIIEVIKPRI